MNLENLVDEYLKVCENQNNLNYKTVKSYKLDLKDSNSESFFLISCI